MLIQIYEITSADEASALSAMGVDHIGVLVGDGAFPREQPIAGAQEIFSSVHSGAKHCALSLSSDLDLISEIADALSPDILHLGAGPERLSPADVQTLKARFPALPIMRSRSSTRAALRWRSPMTAWSTCCCSTATIPATARSAPSA